MQAGASPTHDLDQRLAARALANARYGILITGPELDAPGPVIRFANQAMADLTGYAVDELIGASPRLFQGPETDRAELDRLRAALGEGRAASAETVNYRKDGSSYFVEWTIDPIHDETGRLEAWVSIQRDVTRRRQSRLDLQASEERLHAIFTNASVGLSELDAAGRFVRVNAELCRILGRSGAELLRLGVQDVTDERDFPSSLEAMARLKRAGEPVKLDKRYRRPDGSIVWAQSSLTALRGADGRSENILVVTMDISERKRAEAALREREARHRAELEQRVALATAELTESRDLLRATMNASTDMIQVFEAIRDEAGQIVDFRWIVNNHASELRYGEVRGESLLTRNPGVVAEGIFDTFRRVTETGEPAQAERHYVHEQFDGWFLQTAVKLGDGVATTTKDITDWKRAQADILRLQEEAAQLRLRESEERFRSFADNSGDVLWIMDAQTRRVDYLSPAFERIWGESPGSVIGDPARWAELVHPDDAGLAAEVFRRACAGESVQISYRIVRADDRTVRWIEDSAFPIRDAAGRISHVGGIMQDVTRQLRTAEHLRENRRRLLAVIEGIPQLVWRAGGRGEWTWASPQWSAYTGQREEASHGFGWTAMLHPDDRARARSDWDKADGSCHIAMETRLFHAKEGRYRWFQTRALPVRDEDGRILEWLGTSTDIDDLRQLQERQQVLVGELQHRTRNLLGVVRSIAERTAAGRLSIEAFLPQFRERLGALSRINGLLSKLEQGERVTFDEMIRAELEARGVPVSGGEDGVTLEGPSGVRLRSATVQTFALAIHELTTNAVKYGALSNGTGHLTVRWAAEGEGSEQRLRVEWIESGVPDMPKPGEGPQGGGYGRELIERALPYQLQARTTYELRPDGVRCTIDLPLR